MYLLVNFENVPRDGIRVTTDATTAINPRGRLGGITMLCSHSRAIASPFCQAPDFGLRSSHLNAQRLQPLAAERSKQRSRHHRDLTLAASDGLSNTGFAIDAPGM